jgi:chloride channel 3/4/5
MISVMISKWVADAFGPDGIYASWIALRRYPWLAPMEFRDNGEIAADAMTPVNNLVVLPEGTHLGELGQYYVLFSWVRRTGLTRIYEQEDCWKRGSFTASQS